MFDYDEIGTLKISSQQRGLKKTLWKCNYSQLPNGGLYSSIVAVVILQIINTLYVKQNNLSKANINALLYTNRISQEEYNRFLNMDKKNREISIGLMIRNDRSIYKDIQKGIIEAKRKLFLNNSIDNFEVVSIKNDAVFIHGRALQFTQFSPFDYCS